MSTHDADTKARLRHEARQLRTLARQRRVDLRTLRARPIGQRDPVAELRTAGRINEYTLAAKRCDAEIAKLLPARAEVA
jgi:hypothetical protein